ncbi:hypothetical protein PGIGA_G00156450 [Pangasianodon gigas]|uniref:Uncharacterized protein n=1 Tax=Pangasianodon gigas TaxID=30993 RepID=A0ACC5XQ41_PANGG|nr:hypothetical protein [Pangasianodon gigas]
MVPPVDCGEGLGISYGELYCDGLGLRLLWWLWGCGCHKQSCTQDSIIGEWIFSTNQTSFENCDECAGCTVALFVHVVHSYRRDLFIIALSISAQMRMGSLLSLVPIKISSLYCLREFSLATVTSALLIRDKFPYLQCILV